MKFLRAVAAATALALFAGACGATRPPETLIGVRKVSLAVAFSDEALKPPPSTVQLPDVVLPVGGLVVVKVPNPMTRMPPPDPCPKAPPDATPDEPATTNFTQPPAVGRYLKRNTGTIKVTGPVPLNVPYPPITQITISHVETTVVRNVYYGDEPVTTFESEEMLAPGLSVKSYYSYSPRELTLVKEEVITNGQVTSFVPAPAIVVFPFTGPGSTWTSAGADAETRTTAAVNGAIDGKRELIDICGEVFDTLKVSTNETRAAVENQAVSGSGNSEHPDAPIVQNYAPQLGGLVLRREEHSQRTVQSDSAPLTLQIDVVSTLLSTKPTGLALS